MHGDDEDLMRRVAEGDERAFAALVERHLNAAYAIARRVLRDAAEAEDAAQEAFTRVWTHAAEFRADKAGFATWFRRILVNGCLDSLCRRRDTVPEDLDALLAELVDPDAGPEARTGAARDAARLQLALGRLPERQRLAVVLCYFEDLSNPEAAQAMGLHTKALEGLLSRARDQLRRWLPRQLLPGAPDEEPI